MNTEMEMRRLPIGQLKPAKYNPRKDLRPGDAAYEKIKRSLHDFGYVDPIVWNETTGNIVGGHQRYKVLRAEGATEVDCVVVHIDDPNDEKALNLALNKATGDWEPVALADLLQSLQVSGYDVTATGFDAAEIDDLFSQVHDREVRDDDWIDGADEIEPFVKRGDVWTLGRHILMCGDAANADDVDTLMGSARANLILTDLPAGEPGEYDAVYAEAIRNMKAHAAAGASAYLFHADRNGVEVRRTFKEAGFHLSGVCIWAKGHAAYSPMPYQTQHEPVLYGWLPTGKHRWYSDRSQTTLWQCPQTKPLQTMKPVPLLAYPIKNSSAPNGVVMDLFGGSGSTLIACEQSDRVCRMMEIDERWATVIVERYVAWNGQSPEGVTVVRDGKKYRYAEV